MRTLSCLSFLTALTASNALAAGYAIDVHGGRAVGMAAAVTAMIDDASAAYYNPAGLAQGKGLEVELGDTLIAPLFRFEDPSGGSTDGVKQVVPPAHLYTSYGITDDLSVGLGVFSPFGLIVEWPRTSERNSAQYPWAGRFLSQRSELDTFFINPEVAYRIHQRVRIGAGVQIVRAIVKLERSVPFPNVDGYATLAGGSWGAGGNGGIQVEAIPKLLSFGATYRSRVKHTVNGKAHFDNVPIALQNMLYDQPVTTRFTLPDEVSLGVAYWPLPALHLSFNANYLSWQNLQDITINFDNPAVAALVSPKRWSHTWNYHLGAEYLLNETWAVRGGLMWDPTPSPQDTLTPELPDANRVNIAAGGGYRWRNFRVDLGVQLVVITNVKSTAPSFPGTYSGVAPLASLTVGAKLP